MRKEAVNMSNTELLALVAKQQTELDQKRGGESYGLVVKRNASGGLFVRDASVTAYSAKKDKDYIPSLNIHSYQLNVFKSILANPELSKACLACINEGTAFRQ